VAASAIVAAVLSLTSPPSIGAEVPSGPADLRQDVAVAAAASGASGATASSAPGSLAATYAALTREWEARRDPRALESAVTDLLQEQRSLTAEPSVAALLTERLLADIKYDLGDLDQAQRLAEHALAGLTLARGEADTETLLTRLVRVKILRDRARWREAALECEVVLALAEPNADRRPWRQAQVELMFMYDKLGRRGEAAALGERALREGSADTKDVIAAVLLDRLAGVYLSLGRSTEAHELQQRAQDLYLAHYGPDHEATLSAASNLATTMWEVGRREEVVALERDTVRRRQAISDVRPRNALITRNLLAEHLLLLGRLDEAETEFRAALVVWHEKFGQRDPDALDVRYFLARIAIERGRLQEARATLEDVCQAYETLGDTYEGAPQHCRQRLAGVLWQLGERERAVDMLGDALAGFETRIERGYLSDRSQQSAFAQRVPAFRRWAEWLIVRGDPTAAFAVSERLRARTLLQSIVLRHADASPALPAAEGMRLAEHKARLGALDQKIAEETDAGRRAMLGAERDGEFRALASLRETLGRRFPAYGALSAVRSITPAAAARLLPADTAAITYLIGDERLHAFVITRKQGLRTIDLGPVKGLRDAVDAAHTLMGAEAGRPVWRMPDGSFAVGQARPAGAVSEVTDWQNVADHLGRRLLAPLSTQLRGLRHLVIVPDGPLALLPFEALPFPRRPLVASVTVRYVQSMSVLAAIRARPPRRASHSALLSIGAPDFALSDELRREPSPERSEVAAIVRSTDDPVSATRRGYDLLQMRWSPLPGAAAEIAQVQAAFSSIYPTLALTGRSASEPTLQGMERRRELGRFRYIHVATHGYLSPSIPALSAIVLSPSDVGPGADGYLTAAELPAYHFDSELIVLSTCESGRGAELEGEGIMGLPYALFVGGNRSAVLTLWEVGDDSSARFVARFFSQVAAGAAPAVALARTKREFFASRRWSHPRHWTGFVLYGP
jgi:CHAT domain-containing protein/tetratricopeptide (TPR) repeat protein